MSTIKIGKIMPQLIYVSLFFLKNLSRAKRSTGQPNNLTQDSLYGMDTCKV